MSLLLDALKKAAEQKARRSEQEAPEQRSSDKTLIRAGADDISGFGEGVTGSARGDETELDHSETRYRPESDLSQRIAGDETGLDIADVTEARLETGGSVHADADETGLDIADIADTRSAELDGQLQTGDDSTDFREGSDVDASALTAGDETDISQPAATADEIESALPHRGSEPDETSVDEQESDVEVVPQADADEYQDLSLLLVEQTDLNANTSLTDPNIPPDITRLTAGADDTLDGLGLVEKRDHDVSGEQTDTESAAITNPTAAIGKIDDTRPASGAITQSTLTRAEATSTRTYAPDNYDRTLMKSHSDEASKIFAGMKSDADVVMTPGYAKKVFSSKTSAQRVQHYKVYGGMVVVILFAISIFGAFEYQDESSEIDTSLRPLKRDPMPGIIKIAKPEETDLFPSTDTATSARTIEIIEAANEDATAAETAAAEEQPAAVAEVETAGAEVEAEDASAPTTQAEVEPVEPRQTRAAEAEPIELATGAQSAAPEAEAIDTAENLDIESSSQVSETDTWLQEAYSAYQSGDYRQAMERYNQVLEVDPNNRNALLARAAINIHEGNTEAAIQDYRGLLLANPKDSLAMSSLLTVASYSPEDTETQLKLLMRDEPDSPYLNFALANAYGAQNRWQEAQGYYFEALQNNPDDPNYAYNLAVSLEHISQPGSAITYYRRALENFENGLATFNRDVVDQRLQLLGKL
ncbi:MAG: tetratricopeptide repeat protein [Gammaproteobacteria bacterium]|nr:tetratricopeptide repeat protein [Gammaproteobacteria bacterium]